MANTKKYDRLLSEDEVSQYVREESIEQKFESFYNYFVESDAESFKAKISELDRTEFTKFIIYTLDEMRIDPCELSRTLRAIVE